MAQSILDQDLQAFRARMDDIVKDLHQLTIDIKHDELAQTVSELRTRVNEPFMFVIVGEVKTGKSSFINALLDTGKEIVPVAPEPMTDAILQVSHGDTEREITINPFLKKIMQPIDILKEITIVDTPGTNTIIGHHQEITERFVPSSDLIVFVFEAKNPYRQSAWDFFQYIHQDWRKKIIFVLQQADLLDPKDLEINREGLIKQATEKGDDNPTIFVVSAKYETQGKKTESGFETVRSYIQQNITGGKAPFLKLENNISTSLNICERIDSGIETRYQQYEADKAFRQEVRDTLTEQETRSFKQVNMLIENLLGDYDRITQRAIDEISGGLNFFSLAKRSLLSVFSKEASIKEWLNRTAEKMENDLNRSFNEKLKGGVVDVADSIQQMVKLIDLKIKNSQTILREDHDIFGDIADKRSNILRELQEAFDKFLKESENFVGREVFDQHHSISPNLATASGLAVIGVVIAAVTQGMFLDVTGGILTAIGLIFAGVTVSTKRRKILGELKRQIHTGREKLDIQLHDNLKAYVKDISRQIDEKFHNFDAMIAFETKEISRLREYFNEIKVRLEKVHQEVKTH